MMIKRAVASANSLAVDHFIGVDVTSVTLRLGVKIVAFTTHAAANLFQRLHRECVSDALLLLKLAVSEGRVDLQLLFEAVVVALKDAELLQESVVGISLLALSLDELKGIVKLHAEEAHEEHKDGGGRARHAHGAVDQALRVEVLVLGVHGSEQLLDTQILGLLAARGRVHLLLTKIDLERLVGNGHVLSLELVALLDETRDVVALGNDGVEDEVVDLVEDVGEGLLLGVCHVDVQILDVRYIQKEHSKQWKSERSHLRRVSAW